MKVCPASTPEREARKIANEMLRPLNQGLQTIGSATCFEDYIENTYKPVVLPLLANTTQSSYEGTLSKYLIPAFRTMPLREMTTLNLQRYFSELGQSTLSGDTVLKIKEVLSSVLGSAVGYELLTRNPMLTVRIPRNKVVNKKKKKPHLTPEEFDQLVNLVDEPYATMIYVAVHTGLRVSELVGLRWEDVHGDGGAEALTVDERYCRGDWSVTKTVASSTTIPVDRSVVDRILGLKNLEVEVNWAVKAQGSASG
jgi:integrase